MRKGIEIEVTASDRARLETIVADRNSPQKHVWRARVILATADGCGTAAIMRRAGVAKPCVWRWQERFHDRGRRRESVVDEVVRRMLEEPAPGETTHWTAPAMAAATGISVSSVQRIGRARAAPPSDAQLQAVERPEVRPRSSRPSSACPQFTADIRSFCASHRPHPKKFKAS